MKVRKIIFNLVAILILIVIAVGCSENSNIKTNENIQQGEQANKPTKQEDEKNKSEDKIEIPNIKDMINTLCSDNFGGRLVGSEGNDKTEKYLEGIIEKLKLDKIFGDEYYEGYTQEVFKTLNINGDNGKPENKEVHNLMGAIKGTDSKKAVVISAHFDHIGYQDKKIIRGALDNASGVATLIQIANNLKNESQNKVFKQDIIFAFFNGEEMGMEGSRHFIESIKNKYSSLYNINIDCVGGKNSGKITLANKSKISSNLTTSMKEIFKNNNIPFSEVQEAGDISDERSFDENKIPNIYIRQEKLKPYIHKETDTPDQINYDEIQKVIDILTKFVDANDGETFNK